MNFSLTTNILSDSAVFSGIHLGIERIKCWNRFTKTTGYNLGKPTCLTQFKLPKPWRH